MKQDFRWLATGLAVSTILLFVSGRGDAGGDKGIWQPILPKDVYQELAKREAERIREVLAGTPDDKAVDRAKFGAVFLAALTLSVKEGVPNAELQGTRETALELAATLNKKGQVAAAKKLAAGLPNAKADPNAKMAAVNWGGYLQIPDLMDHYRTKDKRGDGIHPDLQSNIRLKGALNGVEEKLRALAMKELTAVNIKKEGKELELLGYHMAVVGELTYYYAPAKKVGPKDPQEWRTLSNQMRDQSVGLAVAAQKEDAAGVLKVANNLNSTCSQCHTVFRN